VLSRIKAKLGAAPRKVAQRFGWGLADQAMCSVSNAAVSFYVARELGATKFGAFSLAYVTYSFALTASRGLATDPFLVRFSGTDLVTWRRAAAECTGTALVTGLVTGACALLAALLLHGEPRLAFLALGLTLPGLLLQDSWRYSFFALGRGGRAFLNDTIWTLTLVPPLLILRITHSNSVFWLMSAWGIAAAFAACIGPLQARVIPKPAKAWNWLAKHRDLGFRYLAENAANGGAGQLRTYALGLMAGLAAVGYVQAAALLMGPFLVIFLGMSLVTVPEATRVLRHSPGHLRLYCALVGAGMAVLALIWGLALLVALPKGLGALLLGKELWRPASRLVLPYTFSVMGFCLIGGASAGLHALGVAKRSLRAMIIASVIYLGCNLTGAYLDGAAGTVRGAALATWVGAVVWWWQLHLAMRESDRIPSRGLSQSGRDRKLSRLKRPPDPAPAPAPDRPPQPTSSRRLWTAFGGVPPAAKRPDGQPSPRAHQTQAGLESVIVPYTGQYGKMLVLASWMRVRSASGTECTCLVTQRVPSQYSDRDHPNRSAADCINAALSVLSFQRNLGTSEGTRQRTPLLRQRKVEYSEFAGIALSPWQRLPERKPAPLAPCAARPPGRGAPRTRQKAGRPGSSAASSRNWRRPRRIHRIRTRHGLRRHGS
jgi:O-antigen/teichoic acid export membrane protein